MALRKVSVLITGLCALAAAGLAVGRVWVGPHEPPALGDAVVVPRGPEGTAPGRPPSSRSASRAPVTPGAPATRSTSPTDTRWREPGGQPVSTIVPPLSSESSSPGANGGAAAGDGGTDDGNDGNDGGDDGDEPEPGDEEEGEGDDGGGDGDREG